MDQCSFLARLNGLFEIVTEILKERSVEVYVGGNLANDGWNAVVKVINAIILLLNLEHRTEEKPYTEGKR